MSYRLLRACDAHWRESNQMGILNTDLAKQLEASRLGARLWRLRPGQASTRHRHAAHEELYVLIEGEGRIRIGDEVLTLGRGDTLLVEPATVRQVFNDAEPGEEGRDALWLVVGAPPEPSNTLEMSPEQLRALYPDGPLALPPELGGGERT